MVLKSDPTGRGETAASIITQVAVLTGLTTGLLTTVLFRDWKRIYPKKK